MLNFQGARAAIDAELATSFMGTARQILWALYGDYGLKPERIDMGCDGVCATTFQEPEHPAKAACTFRTSLETLILSIGCSHSKDKA